MSWNSDITKTQKRIRRAMDNQSGFQTPPKADSGSDDARYKYATSSQKSQEGDKTQGEEGIVEEKRMVVMRTDQNSGNDDEDDKRPVRKRRYGKRGRPPSACME